MGFYALIRVKNEPRPTRLCAKKKEEEEEEEKILVTRAIGEGLKRGSASLILVEIS